MNWLTNLAALKRALTVVATAAVVVLLLLGPLGVVPPLALVNKLCESSSKVEVLRPIPSTR